MNWITMQINLLDMLHLHWTLKKPAPLQTLSSDYTFTQNLLATWSLEALIKCLTQFCCRFDIQSKHGAFYTGGNVEWHDSTIFCQTTLTVSAFDINSGSVTSTIGDESSEESDSIHTFAADSKNVVTAHKSGLLKLWTHDGKLQKMWKGIHKGPVARLALKEKLASGGSDGVVRIWDIVHQTCVLALRGPVGVVNVVEFHPNENLLLASGT